MTQFQVTYRYTYFKHLPRCVVQACFTIKAITAKQAIDKAMKREPLPIGLISVMAQPQEVQVSGDFK